MKNKMIITLLATILVGSSLIQAEWTKVYDGPRVHSFSGCPFSARVKDGKVFLSNFNAVEGKFEDLLPIKDAKLVRGEGYFVETRVAGPYVIFPKTLGDRSKKFEQDLKGKIKNFLANQFASALSEKKITKEQLEEFNKLLASEVAKTAGVFAVYSGPFMDVFLQEEYAKPGVSDQELRKILEKFFNLARSTDINKKSLTVLEKRLLNTTMQLMPDFQTMSRYELRAGLEKIFKITRARLRNRHYKGIQKKGTPLEEKLLEISKEGINKTRTWTAPWPTPLARKILKDAQSEEGRLRNEHGPLTYGLHVKKLSVDEKKLESLDTISLSGGDYILSQASQRGMLWFLMRKDRETFVYHWNGVMWMRLGANIPNAERLSVDENGTVYVAVRDFKEGYSIMKEDGGVWKKIYSTGPGVGLKSFSAMHENQVWMVLSDVGGSNQRVALWDGKAVSPVSLESIGDLGPGELEIQTHMKQVFLAVHPFGLPEKTQSLPEKTRIFQHIKKPVVPTFGGEGTWSPLKRGEVSTEEPKESGIMGRMAWQADYDEDEDIDPVEYQQPKTPEAPEKDVPAVPEPKYEEIKGF